MASERTFRKELTRAQLLDVVLFYLHRIGKQEDELEIIKLIEKMAAEIVTGSWSRLWLKDDSQSKFYSDSVKEKQRIEIPTDKGLIGQCFLNKKPCFINMAEEDNYFDAAVDNIEAVSKKDIIAVPIFDDHNENIIAVLQTSNTKKDLQQFTANDLQALEVITKFITNMIQLIQTGNLNRTRPDEVTAFHSELHDTIATLTQQKEAAEATVESSTQFLAEVAHEIRTPMNAVMGFLELLHVDETDEQRKVYLDTAMKSGEMMVALINDLLDFTKIEKGMMELEAIDFNPIKEFASIGPLFCGRMKKSHIDFSTFVDPNMPKMIASDPLRIKQILSNLIGNAIKFTPEKGAISLDIVYNPADKTIDFSVKDTGKGIAKSAQEKIFEAFRQETKATARQHGGTGLGLSISTKLATLLGGKLMLESEEGKGSRFFFSIPIAEHIIDPDVFYDKKLIKKSKIGLLFSEDSVLPKALLQRYFNAYGIAKSNQIERKSWDAILNGSFTQVFCSYELLDPEAAQQLLDKGIPLIIVKNDAFKNYKDGLKGPVIELPCPIGAQRLYDALLLGKALLNELDKAAKPENRVLVVDDNAINIQFMQAVSKRLGVNASSASDGTEAVEIYQNAMKNGLPFDMILMDENMPTMNGMEATRKILEIEKKEEYPHTPIIGLSANATEEQRANSLEAGMDGCIFKPVGIKQITEVFDQFLKNK